MYENVTYEAILERMLNRVSGKFDKREGSVIFDTHSPTAVELQILYIELDALIRESYGDTASREFLIKRCRERGITPYQASKAVLRGRITPDNIDVTGKRFNIDSLNYIVTEKTADGEYSVECETPGNVGNQYLGEMIPIEYIDGLESAELTDVLIYGEDEENTEALRERYFASFNERAFGGNVRDYLERTGSISGVEGVKVERVWNSDIKPSDLIPSAKVTEWVQNTVGSLDAEVAQWLTHIHQAAAEKKLTTGGTVLLTIQDSAFGTPSETLLKSVQNAIDPEENAGEGYGAAPIGHVVNVKGVSPREVFVNTDIIFEAGHGWADLRSSIEEKISDYLLELRKTWADSSAIAVRVSHIETRLLSVRGIIDISNTKINGIADNLILDKYEIPIFGGVEE